MNLRSTRGAKNLCGIADIDSTAWHDDDAPCCLGNERLQKGNARLSRRGLTAGEDALEAETDEGLQSGMGIAAYIEGAMKGEGYGGNIANASLNSLPEGGRGGGHETLTGYFINVAIGSQRTDHHSIHACLTRQTDVADDERLLGGIIEKIARTRTHEDMATQTCYLHGGFYQSQTGRKSAFGKTGTEFYAVGTTLGGTMHTEEGAAADFKTMGN